MTSKSVFIMNRIMKAIKYQFSMTSIISFVFSDSRLCLISHVITETRTIIVAAMRKSVRMASKYG